MFGCKSVFIVYKNMDDEVYVEEILCTKNPPALNCLYLKKYFKKDNNECLGGFYSQNQAWLFAQNVKRKGNVGLVKNKQVFIIQ